MRWHTVSSLFLGFPEFLFISVSYEAEYKAQVLKQDRGQIKENMKFDVMMINDLSEAGVEGSQKVNESSCDKGHRQTYTRQNQQGSIIGVKVGKILFNRPYHEEFSSQKGKSLR